MQCEHGDLAVQARRKECNDLFRASEALCVAARELCKRTQHTREMSVAARARRNVQIAGTEG